MHKVKLQITTKYKTCEGSHKKKHQITLENPNNINQLLNITYNPVLSTPKFIDSNQFGLIGKNQF